MHLNLCWMLAAVTVVLQSGEVAEAANTVPRVFDRAVTIVQASSLLYIANVSDPDAGQTRTFTLVAAPAHGVLKTGTTILLTGSTTTSSVWYYYPNGSFVGADAFRWKVSDGFAESDVATCSVTVTPNTVPVIETPSVNLTVVKDTVLELSGYLRVQDPDPGQTRTFTLVAAPGKGTLTDGVAVLTTGATKTAYTWPFAPAWKYTPNPGYVGADRISWKIFDGAHESVIATISLNTIALSSPGAPPQFKAGVPLMDGLSPMKVGTIVENGRLFPGPPVQMAAPEVVDWNNDGLADLLVGQSDGHVILFLNQGTRGSPAFSGGQYLRYRNGLGILSYQWGCSCPGGKYPCATPRSVDWNNDGRKDLVMGVWGDGEVGRFSKRFGVTVCLNVGTDAEPVFTDKIWCLLEPTLPASGLSSGGRPSSMPFVTDINADGFPDVLSGENNVWFSAAGKYGPVQSPTQVINFYLGKRRNLGPDAGALTAAEAGRFYLPHSAFFSKSNSKVTPMWTTGGACPVGSRKSVVAQDWSGSGRKDLLIGMQDGTVWFSANVGSPELPIFTAHSRLSAGGVPIVVGDPSKVGKDVAYRNSTADYHNSANLTTLNEARLAVGDLDGDGLADLVAGDVNGHVTFFPRYNPKPVALDQRVQVLPNRPKNITLRARVDSGRPVTFSLLTSPAHGMLSGTAPNLLYTPAAGFKGTDQFTFRASEGALVSAPATVFLAVKDSRAEARSQEVPLIVSQNRPRPVTLEAIGDGDEPLAYSVVTAPAHGTLSGTAPNLTYTPTAGYLGADSFTFKANNGSVDSNTATIRLEVVFLAVNFQHSVAPLPPGYVMDNGALFDTGRGYGWDVSLVGSSSYYRLETDVRVDTCVRSSPPATWSCDLPNGSYLVTLGTGSWALYQDQDRVSVQGALVLDRPAKTWEWQRAFVLTGNVPALVTDGKLRVMIGGGSRPTRLDYLEIRKVAKRAGWATFVTEDTATKGSWKGVYGTEGQWLFQSWRHLPAYAQVNQMHDPYYVREAVWADPTTDLRALQHAWNLDSGRVAARMYSYSSPGITFEVDLPDGQTRRVALYFLDWDGNGTGTQKAEVLDGCDESIVLDSRTLTDFRGGKYLVWDLRGFTKLRLKATTGATMVSGLFFGASLPGTPQTLTSISVSPAATDVVALGKQAFTAVGLDSSGLPMTVQPAFAWTVSGGGTMGNSGIFTAGATPGGPYTVTASAGGKSGTASVTVTAPANRNPKVESVPWADPNPLGLK